MNETRGNEWNKARATSLFGAARQFPLSDLLLASVIVERWYCTLSPIQQLFIVHHNSQEPANSKYSVHLGKVFSHRERAIVQ